MNPKLKMKAELEVCSCGGNESKCNFYPEKRKPKMANEKRLINVNPAYIQHILAKVPYYADEIWKFTAMTQRFPTVDAVELPCRVGDMVYRKDGSWNVVGFECDRGGSWKVKLERWKDWFRDYHERTKVSFKSFGKTVFLTREEAESALAKMDGDGNG